jgi:hypothetical protein
VLIPAIGLLELVDLEPPVGAWKITLAKLIKVFGDLSLSMLTRIALPVKVLFGLAMAAQVQPRLLIARAMGEGYVVVGDFVEEVDLLLLEHGGRSNGVDGRITPSLIKEATVLV